MNKALFTGLGLWVGLLMSCACLIISTPLMAEEKKDESKTIYKKILQQNIQAFEYEEEDWESDRYYDFLKHCMDNAANLNDFRKRRAIFLMLDKKAKSQGWSESQVLNDPVTWKDLNLFCGTEDLKLYLGDKIDRTQTILGKAMLFASLAQPTTDIQALERKQRIIKELISNKKLFDEVESILKEFKASENMFVAFWSNDPLKHAADRRFFNFSSDALNDRLNYNPTILNVRNMFDHFTRLLSTGTTLTASVLLPIYGLALVADGQIPESFEGVSKDLRGSMFGLLSSATKNKKWLGVIAIAAGAYQAMWARETCQWMSDNFALDTFLHVKMMHVAQTMERLKELEHTVGHSELLRKELTHGAVFGTLFGERKRENKEFKQLLELLDSPTFREQPSVMTNKGKVFLGLKLFYKHQEKFEDAMIALGELDMYMGLARLYKEQENGAAKFAFATYQQGTAPAISVKDFWNPMLDPNKVVTNSIELGPDARRNIVITGPNAGGKSTLLKALAITIIMAQSFGIAPAQEITITPFSNIMTYLNITDDIGAGSSLFKAQASRAQHMLDAVQKLENGKFGFIIIDEMFNGTSPKEAESCAFSVAKSLGTLDHCISIIATHFQILTALEAKTPNFSNYNVSVERTRSGGIIYPFKLMPGISHQHVALDILRAQGFSGGIIDDAQRMIES